MTNILLGLLIGVAIFVIIGAPLYVIYLCLAAEPDEHGRSCTCPECNYRGHGVYR